MPNVNPQSTCEKCKDIKELILASQSVVSPSYSNLNLLISTIKDLIIEPDDPREKQPDFYAKDGYILVVNLISLSSDSLGRLRGKATCTFSTDNLANRVVDLDPTLISDRVSANILAVISTLDNAKSLGIKALRSFVCAGLCTMCNFTPLRNGGGLRTRGKWVSQYMTAFFLSPLPKLPYCVHAPLLKSINPK